MTIKEIADIAGVSTATVSFVLNNKKNVSVKTREKILQIIQDSGYKTNNIAKSLRVKSTNTIGVVVEDIRGFAVPSTINGISEYADKMGFQILLFDLNMLDELYNQYGQMAQYKERINKDISFVINTARVDAVIFIAMHDRDISNVINDIEKPFVFAYASTTDHKKLYVTYDSEQIAYETVKYLIDCGHRKIGIVGGLKASFPTNMRLQGIVRGFNELDIKFDNSYIEFGNWEYQSGYDCAFKLLEKHQDISAIFAMNDLMAAGVIDAIRARGACVPKNISVIGFDNREMSKYLSPSLTTIQINSKEIGTIAGKLAINAIKNEFIDQRFEIVPSELVFRDSVLKLY